MKVPELSDESYFERFSKFSSIFIVVMIILFLASTNLGILRTIISVYTQELSSPGFSIILLPGIILSLFGLAKGIGNLTGGYITRTINPRLIIVSGVIIVLIGNLIITRFEGIVGLYISYSLIGLGIGVLYVASIILLSNLSTIAHRGKSMSIMELFVYGGISLGSIFSGQISLNQSFENVFTGALIFIIFAILLTPFLKFWKQVEYKENSPNFQKLLINEMHNLLKNEGENEIYSKIDQDLYKLETQIGEHSTRIRAISNRPNIVYLTAIVSRISDTAIILVLPLFILELGLKINQVGIISSLFTIFWALTMIVSGNLADNYGRKLPLALGLAFEFVGYIVIIIPVLNTQFAVLIFGISIAGIGRGLYYPVPALIITDSDAYNLEGKLLGKYRFILDTSYLLGSILLILILTPLSSTSNRLELFTSSFYIIIGILVFNFLLVNLYLRDPKPRFKQLPLVVKHLNLVKDGFEEILSGYIQLVETENFNLQYYRKAKNIERKADNTLEELTQTTYAGYYDAVDAFELLSLSSKVDKAFGHVLRAYLKMGEIDISLFTNLKELFFSYLSLLKLLIKFLSSIVPVIEKDLLTAAELSVAIDNIEEYMDSIFADLNSSILSDSKSKDQIMVIMSLNILDSLEVAANTIEDASEYLKLLYFKHFG